MRNRPPKYKFYYQGNKIHAVSKYAGKDVRGTATCHADDNFDAAFGAELASRRCNLKVATKRLRHAKERLEIAEKAFADASGELLAAQSYLEHASDEYSDATNAVNDILDYAKEINNAKTY